MPAVQIRPLAVCGSPGQGPYTAAIMLGIEGQAPERVVYGEEQFADKAECESHAAGVARAFARGCPWVRVV